MSSGDPSSITGRAACFSVANHDVNAMFQVEQRGRSVPNVRGDVTPLRAGMKVTAVNTAGGVETDRMARMERLARFLPVGFYYKAFHGTLVSEVGAADSSRRRAGRR